MLVGEKGDAGGLVARWSPSGVMLEIDVVQFGAIETEQLARGWPWLNAVQWMPQLEAVIG